MPCYQNHENLMATYLMRTLVIVHPSWPWQVEPATPAIMKRCAIVVNRLREAVINRDFDRSVLVGPCIVSGGNLPDIVAADLQSIVKSVDLTVDGGLLDHSLISAGEQVALTMDPSSDTAIVAGFFRDLCCDRVQDGIILAGRKSKKDRRLSRCCWPE